MKDFPVTEKVVYLDSASTSQKPIQVIDAVSEFYRNTNSNIHRGIYSISEEATRLYENSRDKVAKFIGAKVEEIVFTKSTTESLNLLSHSLDSLVNEGDEILVSEMEHHSNLIPWQQLCKRKNAVLKFIEVSQSGELKWDSDLVSEKTKIISITHVSNVLGTINPIKEIAKDKKNALLIVDGAQSVPHMGIDVKDLNCDFLAFSAHKMLGPSGVGVLYGRKELLERMDPFLFGGNMIKKVSREGAEWNDLPWKFEAGTPNIEGVIGLGAAVDYLNDYGMDNVLNHEKELADYALKRLREVGADVYGSESRIGVISFNIKRIHAHDLASILAEDNICIRSGHHCAMPLSQKLGIDSSARMSFYIYNTKSDIDKAIESMKKAKAVFGV